MFFTRGRCSAGRTYLLILFFSRQITASQISVSDPPIHRLTIIFSFLQTLYVDHFIVVLLISLSFFSFSFLGHFSIFSTSFPPTNTTTRICFSFTFYTSVNIFFFKILTENKCFVRVQNYRIDTFNNTRNSNSIRHFIVTHFKVFSRPNNNTNDKKYAFFSSITLRFVWISIYGDKKKCFVYYWAPSSDDPPAPIATHKKRILTTCKNLLTINHNDWFSRQWTTSTPLVRKLLTCRYKFI